MKAILVTGGAGFVGSHACKALLRAGYLPVTFDNLERGHERAVKMGTAGTRRSPQSRRPQTGLRNTSTLGRQIRPFMVAASIVRCMIPALAGLVPEATQKSKRRSGTESVSVRRLFGGVLAIVPHHRGLDERKSIRDVGHIGPVWLGMMKPPGLNDRRRYPVLVNAPWLRTDPVEAALRQATSVRRGRATSITVAAVFSKPGR